MNSSETRLDIFFFIYFIRHWSLIEIERTARTRSRSPTVEHINIKEHLFTTLEESAKRRSEVIITKTITHREVLK